MSRIFNSSVQSSGTTVAILQASFPVLFGDNNDTTITEVIASLGALFIKNIK